MAEKERRALEELLQQWSENDGRVVVNYAEAQVIIEFLINHDSVFRVNASNGSENIIIRRA